MRHYFARQPQVVAINTLYIAQKLASFTNRSYRHRAGAAVGALWHGMSSCIEWRPIFALLQRKGDTRARVVSLLLYLYTKPYCSCWCWCCTAEAELGLQSLAAVSVRTCCSRQAEGAVDGTEVSNRQLSLFFRSYAKPNILWRGVCPSELMKVARKSVTWPLLVCNFC